MDVGVVSVVYGARCEVLAGGVSLPCLLRGRLKQAAMTLAVGDRVEYRRLDDQQGVVERVLERRNELSRSNRERPRRKGKAGVYPKQVVLANPDSVVFVAAARDPGIDFPLMDRALALARAARLPSAVCVNKMDLAPAADIRRLMRPYERLGIRVLYASAEDGSGLEELHHLLRGQLSFFWGGSGVGKSSLIRALTGKEVKVGRWRTDNPRGPHTTNVTRLYPLPAGGLIADTPGFDWLALDTVEEVDDPVALLLPEAAAVADQCRFPGCTHCGEPDCAVMEAVLEGEIDRGRYARFRHAAAESRPPQRLPAEMLLEGDELFFRLWEGNTAVWTTFSFYYLFEPGHPEKEGLLETLEVAPDAAGAGWTVFQERILGTASRWQLQAKVTSTEPVEELAAEGEELILRERGTVKGIGRIKQLRSFPNTWRLRKALRHTAIYEGKPFWSELKPPRAARLPDVHSAMLTITGVERFEPLPELAMGVLTRQGAGLVLDFLEIGAAEDELAHE